MDGTEPGSHGAAQAAAREGAFDLREDTFELEEFLASLTSLPGVYRMLDRRGRVLYVGKAKSLRKRVASYFRRGQPLAGKTQTLVSQTARVEVTVTHTETEALLLENNLIKEFRPRYNIVLRDDKSYPYIHVTTDQRFPRLAFHRGSRRGRGRYFGPYPSAAATRETLNTLQKLFLVRQCSDSFFGNRSRPCLQHQIKRCTAPCVGLVEAEPYAEDVRHAIMFLEGRSEAVIEELVKRMERASSSLEFELAARYRDQIQSLRRIQERQYIGGARGNIDVVAVKTREGVGVVQVFLIREGQNLGNRTFFPRNTAGATAAEILSAFLPQYYLSGPKDRAVASDIIVNAALAQQPVLEQALAERTGRRVSVTTRPRGPRARWVEMAEANADIALAQHLSAKATLRDQLAAVQEALELDEAPRRIECFDVSHIQGEATVASCVVFGPDGPIKSDYRRFNIRDVPAGDDYGAMAQALARRYARLKREDGKLPDLLLIDGGRGQLARAAAVLEELQVEGVALASVVKGPGRRAGFDRVLRPGRSQAVRLGEDSAALHLLQRIRDEAHRFAVTGHRNRRTRSRQTSSLQEIPGIGAVLRQRLLTEFGGLQGVSRAGVEDLARVRGVSRALAQSIYDALRSGG